METREWMNDPVFWIGAATALGSVVAAVSALISGIVAYQTVRLMRAERTAATRETYFSKQLDAYAAMIESLHTLNRGSHQLLNKAGDKSTTNMQLGKELEDYHATLVH